MTDIPGLLAEAPDAHEWRFVSLPAINEDGNEFGLITRQRRYGIDSTSKH